MKRFVENTRYMIVLASLATAVGAVALLVVGAIETVTGVIKVIEDPFAEKELVLHFLQVADVMLLATVLYVISLGLYELFVDDTVNLPMWLEIHTLDDLKVKLIGVVVAVLAVFFLGTVLKGGGDKAVLWSGLGTGAVVLSLAAFIWAGAKAHDPGNGGANGHGGSGDAAGSSDATKSH